MSKNELVKNYIRSQIHSGFYNTGESIESENELAAKLQTSRMTVRKAIDDLIVENLLLRRQGKGTYVRHKPRFMEFQCGIGFTEEVRKRNMIPSAKDIQVREVTADDSLADDLHVSKGAPLWSIRRVRCADDMIIALEEEYFVKALIPELNKDIVADSIYRYISEKYGLEFSYADQKLDAVAADKDVAEALGVKIGQPLIRMFIIAHLSNGTAFNCGTTYYRTDQFSLIQTVFKK